MNNDLQILTTFLEHFAPEVSGRVLAAPDAEDAVLLQQFATGACTEKQRQQVCVLLRQHPGWLRWVADQVRLARTVPMPVL